MTQTATAYIITQDALSLGGPELIITTPPDVYTGEAEELERHRIPLRWDLPDGDPGRLFNLVSTLTDWWPVDGSTTTVRHVLIGYYTLDVERD